MHRATSRSGCWGHWPWVAALVGVLASSVAPAADSEQLKNARLALQRRMEVRYASGWRPKSPDEQLLTRLRASKLQWERRQDIEAQKAAFLAAKAEVYVNLAMRYASVARVTTVYENVPVIDSYTGEVSYRRVRHEYRQADPWSAALAAWWGERGATAKGMAAAKEYRANTYYRKIGEMTAQRIAALESQILVAARER